MDLAVIFENKIAIALLSAAGGILITFITQKLLNKRGLFTYFVWHSRVGISADDVVYGLVQVTWNNSPVNHLYMSTVELINESTRDYETVVVRAFTNDTALLTEKTEIVGTTRLLAYSEDYAARIFVPQGQQPTQEQRNLYRRQRDYIVPVMNRGQMIRFQFLNAAHTEAQPSIWLDVLHKGVKVKFRVAHNKILGVPQPIAALYGTFLGFIFVGFIILYAKSIWSASIAAFVFGLCAQIPGAYFVKVCRRIRDWSAD